MFPRNFRSLVAELALEEEGKTDPTEYWVESGVAPPFPRHWCGAFALTILHRAGLGRDVKWIVEKGFLYKLRTTLTPRVGDIAYFRANQHHAVVVGVDGSMVRLVNGNGVGGKVTVSTSLKGAVTTFYSIQEWIDAKVK